MTESTPIELEATGSSTIHITKDSMRYPAICITVDDTEALNGIILNSDSYPRYVVTQVKPFGDNNTLAEVIFREQTSYERAQTQDTNEEGYQRFSVPEGTVASLFEGMPEFSSENNAPTEAELAQLKAVLTETLSNIPEGTSLESLMETIKENVEQTGISISISSTMIDKETGEEIHQKDAAEELLDPDEFVQTYRIVLPLSTIDLAHHIWSTTEDSPAFIIATESMLSETDSYTDNTYSVHDMLAVIEFPDMASDEYTESIVEMMKAISGRYFIQPTAAEFAKARAMVLDLIFRLSKGDEDALSEVITLGEAVSRVLPETPTATERPKKEDYFLYSIQQVLDMIYGSTAPDIMFTLLEQSGAYDDIEDEMVPDEHILNESEYARMDDLLRGEELTKMFQGIMEEEYAKKGLKLAEKPNEEDIYEFYATPITENTFPLTMRELVKSMSHTLIYERDWNSDAGEFSITKENAGEVIVAQMLTLGARYARVHELANLYNLPFSPVGVFVGTVSNENEDASWLLAEAARKLVEEQKVLFREIIIGRLPETVDGRLDALNEVHPRIELPVLLVSSAFAVIHNFGHSLVESGLKPEILDSYLSMENSLKSFISDVIDEDEEEDDEDEEGVIDLSHTGTCYETIATIDYLTTEELTNEKIVQDLIEALEAFGFIIALRDTDIEQDTIEWDSYIKELLVKVVNNRYQNGE